MKYPDLESAIIFFDILYLFRVICVFNQTSLRKKDKKREHKTYFVTSLSISQVTRICESQRFQQLSVEGGVSLSKIELESFIM